MSKRRRLGKRLGIPVSIIESIEMEAARRLSRKQQMKAALEMMMSYWFEKGSEPSLDKLASILIMMEEDGHLQDGQNEQGGVCSDCSRSVVRILKCGQSGQVKQHAETIRKLVLNAADVEQNDVEISFPGPAMPLQPPQLLRFH